MKQKVWNFQSELEALKGKKIFLIINDRETQHFDELVDFDDYSVKVRKGKDVAVIFIRAFDGFRGE